MSELRSVADALAAESPSEMPDARVEEDFAELHRAVERLERERLRRLAEIDRRRMYERDGHLSAASWLVRAFKLSWGAAREDVRMARALDAMPHTSKGLEEGEVSLSAARVLVQARAADPEAFRDAEGELVQADVCMTSTICTASRCTGDRRSNATTPATQMRRSARGDGSMPRCRSWGWSGSMATWTPSRERRC